MEYCSLMSGSWGNCHYIKGGNTRILIDAGQTGKRVLANLAAAGLGDGRDLTGILVTHAHRDHVTAVGVLARKLKVPVYATEGTWCQMEEISGPIPEGLKRVVRPMEKWRLNELEIEAFPTSHDALESVGYVVRCGSQGIGVATDLGVFTDQMAEVLSSLECLALEANHDLDMLRFGRYPVYLKKRISGVSGHLSNEDAAAGLLRILCPKTRHVVLAHLSEENNTPEKALDCVRGHVASYGGEKNPELKIIVAPRCVPGPRILL